MLIEKRCGKCKEMLDFSEFYRDSSRGDGLATICKECDSKKQKRYRENNALKISKMEADRYQRRKSDVNKRNKQRRDNDLNYSMACRLRNRIRSIIKGESKCASNKELLGCSYEEFIEHIESKFVDGMSWDNRSEWHIDHIKPCSAFDLTSEEGQRKCFHYSNLQPLWALDNLRKSDKYG